MITLLVLLGILCLVCVAIVVAYTLVTIWMRFWWLIIIILMALALIGIESFWRAIFL
jgi:hypothetical protein